MSCPVLPVMLAPILPALFSAEEPQNQDSMTLLVDVGTNAEIVLGNRHRLLACSSPTGPAFEGCPDKLRPASSHRCH